MKRNLIFISFLLFSMLVSAQFNRNNLRNQNVRPDTRIQKAPEFNTQKVVGLNIYDIEKVLKKIGVKKTSDNFKKAASVFKVFNKKNKELSRINTFTFSEVKKTIEAAQKKTQKTRDASFIQNAYKQMGVSLKDVVQELSKREKQLDADLEPLLSKKQLKKWKKYKARVRKNKN